SDVHGQALSAALRLDGEQAADRPILFAGALALLQRLAVAGPLLLAVDDLQWIDRSSAAVLGFVARRLERSRIGFIAAMLDDPDTFFDDVGIPEHDVRPLDHEAAARLLGHRFPELAPQVRRRVLTEAAGNPLAL